MTEPNEKENNVIFDDFGVKVEVELVLGTPEYAADILEHHNHSNRQIKNTQLSELTGALKRGEWVFNGDTVVFDDCGELADGQHRLTMIRDSGMPLPILVVRGVPRTTAQMTIDRNVKRSLGDTLRMRGESNYPQLAGAIGYLNQLQSSGVIGNKGGGVSIPQGVAILEANPGLRESVQIANRLSDAVRYPPSLGTALHYVFAGVDQEDADEMFHRLITGANLVDGSPLLVLRKRLETELSRTANFQVMPTRYRAAITIKAWNSWRRGDSISLLKFRSGGSKPEPFPRWDVDIDRVEDVDETA